MAINIFSGGSKPSSSNKTKTVNKRRKSRDSGNQDLRSSALSNEGTVGVKKKGILNVIGGLAKKAIPLAAKFAPGPIGTAAKIAENFFNDQEWWESVPGESVSMNAPLAPVATDDDTVIDGAAFHTGAPTSPADAITYDKVPQKALRAVMLEFSSDILSYAGPSGYVYYPNRFFHPSDDMLAQYLMPEMRRVVNAVPLQDAATYSAVLANNACAYAVWRELKACQYLLRNGRTYLPSFNDAMFPILQNVNKPFLDSTVARLEEYLHASVRLPHTLCEYLAWRFGRIYKINQNAKSALVKYNAISLRESIANWQSMLDQILNYNTSTVARQTAATDIFNAYVDHDLNVDILDDTQLKYDMKEFALRTNLDVCNDGNYYTRAYFGTKNPIKIDSDMDNPSVFMSSTVSTFWGPDGAVWPLFPVLDVWAYMVNDTSMRGMVTGLTNSSSDPSAVTADVSQLSNHSGVQYTTTGFRAFSLRPFIIGGPHSSGLSTVAGAHSAFNAEVLFKIFLAKTLEYYNAGFFVLFADSNGGTSVPMLGSGVSPTDKITAYDVTSVSDDLGVSDDVIIKTEQVYAFANLVSPAKRHSMSYKQAEAVVAKETANAIAAMDVAVKA